MRIADTPTLIKMNEMNFDQYNQKMDRSVYERLDPEGIHVCGFMMIHNDDHMRTRWLIKVVDSPQPLTVLIDIPFGIIDKLPEWEPEKKDPEPAGAA